MNANTDPGKTQERRNAVRVLLEEGCGDPIAEVPCLELQGQGINTWYLENSLTW